jgi:hypothetical protein
MTISTVDQLVASTKLPLMVYKNVTLPTVAAGNFYSYWAAGPVPSPGSFSVGNTTTGVIPTQATTGAVTEFVDPTGGQSGYLAFLGCSSTATGINTIYDRVWHAGSFTPTSGVIAGVTGTAVTRPANGVGVELWAEINTALSASAHTLTVTYTNQAGTPGQTATCALAASATSGRMFKFTLAAGDSGVQQVTGLSGSAAPPTGSYNLVLMRRIAAIPTNTQAANWAELALPQLYAASCLFVQFYATAGASPNIVFFGSAAYG